MTRLTDTDLNDKLFPLNTNTYPITRGIKVEIAGIIILCLLGMISQLKVWKLVKERRERKAAARMEHEREREEYEANLGKQIEHHNAKARKQWEKIYGDKLSGKNEPADSGIGSAGDSFHKTSVSIKEYRRSRQNSIELSDVPSVPDSTSASSADLVPKTNGKDGFSRVSLRAVSDDEIQQIDAHGNPVQNQRPPAIQEEAIGYADSRASSDPPRSSVSFKGKSLRPSVAPPPVVLPLPFEIPPEERISDYGPTSGLTQDQTRNFRDKRLSQLSMANRLSTAASLGDELDVPHIEDDRRSSVAATLNDKLDQDSLSKLSPSTTPLKTGFGQDDGLNVPEIPAETKSERAVKLDSPSELKPVDSALRSKSETDLRGNQVDLGSAEKSQQIPPLNSAVMKAASASLTTSTRPKEDASQSHESNGDKNPEAIATSEAPPAASALAGQLPDKLSKIALKYRTNEWAKHLDTAEEPEVQIESRPSTPGVTVEVRTPEPPAPPRNTELPEKPKEEKRPADVARNSSSSSNVYRTSKATPIYASQANSSTSVAGNSPTNNIYNVNSIQRNVSQSSMRNSSASPQHSLQVKTNAKGNRSSSMPLSTQPLVESPVEEGLPVAAPGTFTRMNSSRGTLLDIAEKKKANRTSAALLNRQSSAPNVAITSSSNSSSNEIQVKPEDDEDMPLAQRRSLIQAQRNSSFPAPQQSMVFDSHQPKRTSTVDSRKQAADLALWRDSMRSDMAQRAPRIAEEDQARTQMMTQRRHSQMKQEQQAAAAQHREGVFDNMMRRGDMLDLHREKLHKMQANANRHAS